LANAQSSSQSRLANGLDLTAKSGQEAIDFLNGVSHFGRKAQCSKIGKTQHASFFIA
jgi:hypothetical protein